MNKIAKKQKPIGELLEEALIAKEEQPYQVPENWMWTKVGIFSDIIRGVSYKKNQATNISNDEDAFIIRGGNVQDGTIVNQDDNIYVPKDIVKKHQFVKKGDVIIVSSTGSTKVIGKPALVKENDDTVSFGAFLTMLRPKADIHPEYFQLYFLSHLYRGKIISLAKGSNINNIKKEHLEGLLLPLPNKNEQKRIADKVQRLLNKIDEAKQLIYEAQKNFKFRQAAILNRAFSGELLNNKVTYVELGEIVTIKSGTSLLDHQLLTNGDIPYFKVADMNLPENTREMVFASKFVSSDDVKKNQILPKDTVIFPKRGGAIKTNKKRILSEDALCDLNIMGVICSDKILPHYLYYWFLSIDLGQLDNGSSVPQINNKDIYPLSFPLMEIEDQKEIINILDVLLEKESEALHIISKNLRELEYLKQTVLSKAFKGDLNTNNPLEESAIDSLKEVLKRQMQ